jgi:hypothetical protein
MVPGEGLGVDRDVDRHPKNSSAVCAFVASTRGIVAGQARAAIERASHNPPVAGLLSTPMDGIRQDVNPAHLTTLKAYVLRLHGYGRADLSLIRGEYMVKYSFSMHPSR